MTLAVVFGASDFPGHGENRASMASPKFRASADSFHAYLTSPDHLGLPASRVLNLFDLHADDSSQYNEIKAFFDRQSEPPTLIIFYYVGHGSYRPGQYVLHIRSSGHHLSGLRACNVLAMIPRAWDHVPACFFVDACFAEGAAQEAATSMVKESHQRTVVFLCSSSVLRKSYLSDTWGKSPDITPFTEALLAGLKGDSDLMTESALSGRDIERAMHAYIEARNELNARTGSGCSDRAPKPELAGSGWTEKLFTNPRTLSGQATVPQECKAAQWILGRWPDRNKLQPAGRCMPGWAFFLSTEDQFSYFRDKLWKGWPASAGVLAETGLDSFPDMTVYELLGRHELLLLFHADFRGACAVRDFLLKSSDDSPAVQNQLYQYDCNDETVWKGWRKKNNVTAFCFPKQRARVREDQGKWNLLDGALHRSGFTVTEDSRTIKAFVCLTPKHGIGAGGDSQALAKTFQIAADYPEIIERIYHYPESEAMQCGVLGKYPLGAGSLGFSLDFEHDGCRALLIEILVPCGKFARLNKFSNELRKAGFLNNFVKSTYIAYGSNVPSPPPDTSLRQACPASQPLHLPAE